MIRKNRKKSKKNTFSILSFIFQKLRRRVAASFAVASLLVLTIAFWINILVLQPGPHPAPIFGQVHRSIINGPGIASAKNNHTNAIEASSKISQSLVKQIQSHLAQLNIYQYPIDGVLGEGTRQAIEIYERQHSMPLTGEATIDLLSHLSKTLPTLSSTNTPVIRTKTINKPREIIVKNDTITHSKTLSSQSPKRKTNKYTETATIKNYKKFTSPKTTNINSDAKKYVKDVQVALANLGYGPLIVDGQIGHQTEEAIRRFEESRGLKKTGRYDYRLISRLRALGAM